MKGQGRAGFLADGGGLGRRARRGGRRLRSFESLGCDGLLWKRRLATAALETSSALALIVLCLCLSACARDYVTGKKTLNFYSLATDVKIGTEVLRGQLKEFYRKNVVYDADAAMLGRIRGIVAAIAPRSHIPQFPFEAHHADLLIVNAWCAPGGKIMVYEGLFDPGKGLVARDSDDELAAVLGHEIAHATARHVVETMSRQMSILLVGQILATVVARTKGDLAQDVFNEVFTQGMNIYVPAYSRKNEAEADRLGLLYMAGGGYDPRAAVTLWKRAAAASGHRDRSSIFSSHPASGERAKNLEVILPEALRLYERSRTHFITPPILPLP